jgi:hypothetical protein
MAGSLLVGGGAVAEIPYIRYDAACAGYRIVVELNIGWRAGKGRIRSERSLWIRRYGDVAGLAYRVGAARVARDECYRIRAGVVVHCAGILQAGR